MASTPTQTTICIPGETGWELWKQGPAGMHLAQSLSLESGGSPASFKLVDWFGYPVVSSFAVPVWAASSDQEIIDGVVNLQLEKYNLMPSNPVGQLLDTRVVERMEARTLVTATVIDEKVDIDLPQTTTIGFEVSPALYYLPDNSIILWKELGRLIFCLTRGEHPVYFQALTESELSSAAVSEIESLLMPLYLQEIVPDLDAIVLWTDSVLPGAEQELANTLRLPLRREPKPAPSAPRTPSAFEPVSVALGKIRAAKMRRLRNIIATSAAVYGFIIAGFIGWHLWKVHKVDELRTSVNKLVGTVGFVQPTLDQWALTEPLRNKDVYPIEMIRRTIEPIAVRQFGGVRTLGVRFEENSLEIKCESQAQNVAINYCNFLRSNADTKSLNWVGPTWGPQRNGIFSFTITGKRKEVENGS